MSKLWKWDERHSNFHRRITFYSHLRQNPIVGPDDSKDERAKKIKRINDNYKELKQLQKEKANEIVDLLDLFNGNLSLSDILNQDIPLINSLRDEKINRINKGKVNEVQQRLKAETSGSKKKRS